MSFILEALRKSEHDRQRQSGPGIADIRLVGEGSRFPVWAVAIAVLLLLNIVVVLVLVLRGEAQPAAAATTQPAASAAAPEQARPDGTAVAGSPPQVAGTPPAERAYDSAGIPLPRRMEPSVRDEAQGSDGYEDSAPVAASAPPARRQLADPALDARAEPESDYASLPTINDMVSEQRQVPELHLDIHVYATRPSDRFVFLNMRKYREGGTTPEGTTVERITRDGVVLNHRGLRFVMPRQ